MLELQSIIRDFGSVKVLKGISLSVEEGSFLALLGPSGCGKSTLLRIIAGLDQPSSGQVMIAGRDVGGLTAAQRNVAMVFQSYALYPHLSVAQNIALPLAMRRLSRVERSMVGGLLPGARAKRRAIAQSARDLAQTLDIGALLERKPAQLSGGQKQRVALARALVRDPSIFLLDEPLSNLDAKLRVQMRAEIVALNRRTGRTFVHVTHDQAEAMAMADKVAVMLDGKVAQFGTPRDLYERPASREVAAFVGTHPINVIEGPAGGGLPPLFAHQEPVLPKAEMAGQAVTLAVRPEHLVPDPKGPIEGHLRHVEYQGAEVLLDVACPSGCCDPASGACPACSSV
jgi:multiple sugar transport system ATP-binding protein